MLVKQGVTEFLLILLKTNLISPRIKQGLKAMRVEGQTQIIENPTFQRNKNSSKASSVKSR